MTNRRVLSVCALKSTLNGDGESGALLFALLPTSRSIEKAGKQPPGEIDDHL
jgi:hypothetical protein